MLLIKGAEVYAPEYLGKKDVLIAGEKIERIGEDLPEYEGCQVIDGTGRIVAPGFIDRHVHITGGGGEGSFHTQAPQVQLSDLIRGGVTTVVGLLGTDGISRSTENLVAKAKALKEEGISAYCCCGAYGHPGPTITGSISRDIMFVDEIIGLKLAVSDHRAPNITVDELMEELRMKGITDLNSIKYAILETNGQISVLPYAAQQPVTAAQMELHPKEPGLPLVIINDGRVLEHNLRQRGLDDIWLDRQLKAHHVKRSQDVFLLTVDEQNQVYLAEKEGRV